MKGSNLASPLGCQFSGSEIIRLTDVRRPQAFTWRDGVTDWFGPTLTSLNYRWSYTNDLNQAGQIAGYALRVDPSTNASFFAGYVRTPMPQTVDIGNLGVGGEYTFTYPHAINNHGQVVGASYTLSLLLRAFTVDLSFTDVNVNDAHTASWTWGNSSGSGAGNVTEANGAAEATGSHVYTSAGVSVPTGETEFQFQVAKLNFHSNSYDWLVVAGARAQYKVIGTINGKAGYKFLLTAVDGALLAKGTPDRFRIKIWHFDSAQDADVIDCDNQIDASLAGGNSEGTAIGGGSIVIHK